MKKLCLFAALALSIIAMIGPADARGCLKGAIVGGAAGHYEAQKHDGERYRDEQSRKY
jgi:hypothetical protein